jgi:hypothetical protein
MFGLLRGLAKGVLLVALLGFIVYMLVPAIAGSWIAKEISTTFGLPSAMLLALNVIVFALLSRYGWSLLSFGEGALRAWGLVALLLSLSAAVSLFWKGRDNFRDGRAQKYCAETPSGLYCSTQPGSDPNYGLPLKPITAGQLVLLGRDFFRADPAQSDWFDRTQGLPLLFYRRTANNELEFYSLPGDHPETRQKLLPVTPEIRAEWEASRQKPQEAHFPFERKNTR